MKELRYISQYPPEIQQQVRRMVEQNKLAEYLQNKYPQSHSITNDKALRAYVIELKNTYLKKSAPLSQVTYDNNLHVIHNALGTHHYVSRIQGSKIKSKNEIRIASVFKRAPEAFLNMIAVHELAHLKEKEHNKAFYQLCEHMMPNYHQVEFDMRLYLILKEMK